MIKIIEKIYFLNFSNMYTNWVTTRYVYYQARPYIYTFSVLFILTLGFRVMKSCLKIIILIKQMSQKRVCIN